MHLVKRLHFGLRLTHQSPTQVRGDALPAGSEWQARIPFGRNCYRTPSRPQCASRFRALRNQHSIRPAAHQCGAAGSRMLTQPAFGSRAARYPRLVNRPPANVQGAMSQNLSRLNQKVIVVSRHYDVGHLRDGVHRSRTLLRVHRVVETAPVAPEIECGDGVTCQNNPFAVALDFGAREN